MTNVLYGDTIISLYGYKDSFDTFFHCHVLFSYYYNDFKIDIDGNDLDY